MIAARWCPAHRLVLEESIAGMYCPAGHNWYTSNRDSVGEAEWWVVDMEYPEEHPQFIIWYMRNGAPYQGEWYAAREAADLEVTVRSEYLERPRHWAGRNRAKRTPLSLVEKHYKPRI